MSKVNKKSETLSSEMPAPQVLDYEVSYVITDKFREDLIVCVGDLPYITSAELIKFVDDNKDMVYISRLNEFVGRIAQLPYRYVSTLMANIQNKETQPMYFINNKQK